MKRLKVGFYGTGNRMQQAFLPVCARLNDHVEMVCIGGRSEEKARKIGQEYHLPWYTDIDTMLAKHKLDFVCNILSCTVNYETTAKIVPYGVSCILETPIEIDLDRAAGLIKLAKKHKVNIEVAENSFRHPDDRLARKILDTGMFGPVLLAYNDLVRHGYHGINGMRNLIGFDVEPTAVVAFHESFAGPGNDRTKGMRMGYIHFANNAIGVHSRAYGLEMLPLQVRRQFVAENGWLAVNEGEVFNGKRKQTIRIKRFDHTVGNVRTCKKMVATIGSSKEIVWENPFADKPFSDDHLSVASVIMSMVRAVRDGEPQEYRLKDALRDYEIDSALCSSHANGRRIAMPLDYKHIARERQQGLY
jgi:predicted dehydrogenase